MGNACRRQQQPEGTEKLSCMECCCSGVKDKSRFQNLSTEQIYCILLWNQTGINTLVWIQAIFFAVWQMLAMIPGFALYNGSAGPANAVTHFGWWSLIEFFVILVGILSTTFQLSVPGNVNKLEFPARQASEYCQFYLFVLIIGFISYGVQFGLTINELAYGSGQLASDYLGFGIYFCCQIGIVAFGLYPWIWFRVWVYIQHLRLACAGKVLLFDATPSTTTVPTTTTTTKTEPLPVKEEEQEEEVEEIVDETTPPVPPAGAPAVAKPIGSGIITPMMAKLYSTTQKNKKEK